MKLGAQGSGRERHGLLFGVTGYLACEPVSKGLLRVPFSVWATGEILLSNGGKGPKGQAEPSA